MGIREIEKKIKLREAMEKKAAELRAQELDAKARTQKFTAEKIREIAARHGFILAINDEIKAEIDTLREKYAIPESRIIRKIVTKEEIADQKGKVDHEKLGWFAFQEVLIKKDETGGIFTIPELFLFLKALDIPESITIKNVEKAMEYMAKIKAIAGYETLKSGVEVVYLFDEKFTTDYKVVLAIAKEKGIVGLEDLLGLQWGQQRAEKVLDSLARSGIARYDESFLSGKRWFFPGVK